MLVGDLIARFEDEAVAAETLVALGDIGLTARVSRAAAEQDVTVGEFATASVQRFANRASDEEWVMMIGRMERAEDPGQVFLHHILSAAVTQDGLTQKPRLHTMAAGRTAPAS